MIENNNQEFYNNPTNKKEGTKYDQINDLITIIKNEWNNGNNKVSRETIHEVLETLVNYKTELEIKNPVEKNTDKDSTTAIPKIVHEEIEEKEEPKNKQIADLITGIKNEWNNGNSRVSRETTQKILEILILYKEELGIKNLH